MTNTFPASGLADARGAGAGATSGDAAHFEITLDAPFTLALANEYFGGWPPVTADPAAVGLTFPVEGWRTAATVLVRQPAPLTITGDVYAGGADAARAWQQALAVLSLDTPALGWPEVGRRDPVIGRLQERYDWLRPVLFHSPYEAAAAFVIGHRISIRQGRAVRQAMAQAHGIHVAVGATTLYAFPAPEVLRELPAFPGVSAEKMRRLHGVAEAALAGLLDRAYLRALLPERALAELQELPGIGPFFAQGILLRGAGLVDAVPDDDTTKEAIQQAYGLPAAPDPATTQQMADAWRPFRMWATVLLHVWLRREAGGPHRPAPAGGRGRGK